MISKKLAPLVNGIPRTSFLVEAIFVFSLLTNSPISLAEETKKELSKPRNQKVEILRSKLFKGSLETRRCLTLPKSLKNGSVSIDTDLDSFINDFKKGIETLDSTRLLPLFHPRTVTNLAPVNDLLASMKLTLGAPFEVSTFRLWAVNTVDGNPDPVVCGGLEHTEFQIVSELGPKL